VILQGDPAGVSCPIVLGYVHRVTGRASVMEAADDVVG
jgi:hypothetical protein